MNRSAGFRYGSTAAISIEPCLEAGAPVAPKIGRFVPIRDIKDLGIKCNQTFNKTIFIRSGGPMGWGIHGKNERGINLGGVIIWRTERGSATRSHAASQDEFTLNLSDFGFRASGLGLLSDFGDSDFGFDYGLARRKNWFPEAVGRVTLKTVLLTTAILVTVVQATGAVRLVVQ